MNEYVRQVHSGAVNAVQYSGVCSCARPAHTAREHIFRFVNLGFVSTGCVGYKMVPLSWSSMKHEQNYAAKTKPAYMKYGVYARCDARALQKCRHIELVLLRAWLFCFFSINLVCVPLATAKKNRASNVEPCDFVNRSEYIGQGRHIRCCCFTMPSAIACLDFCLKWKWMNCHYSLTTQYEQKKRNTQARRSCMEMSTHTATTVENKQTEKSNKTWLRKKNH